MGPKKQPKSTNPTVVPGLPLDFIAALTALQTRDTNRPYGILAAHGVTVGDENLQSSLRQIPKCVVCNKDAPAETNGKSSEEASKGMKCPLCKCTVYCSTRCLDEDKGNHDTLCQAFTEFTTQNPRPANHGLNTYKLGALLPENSAGVEFVWVTCELRMKKKDGKNIATHHVDPRQHIGLPPSPSHEYVILDMETTFRDSKRGIDYDHTTSVWWRDEFMMDGSKKNQYLANLPRGEKNNTSWKGPILVTSGYATEISPDQFSLDVTPVDILRAEEHLFGKEASLEMSIRVHETINKKPLKTGP
ncbi:hypothetical protein HYFRA_00009091 [Hymenoscyphus fraxineus]|uniref:MYND-type domain-containing protein n=1 Tax=Hymenoscyphus fraxineus TaxID=746836 RepID=A0A9N9PTY8_9HELO|nr:hypothetical protein HYFRA_00009091 [Hymenoscyphus fraxineus]